ncbi:hypothetical protein N9W20_00210 [Candidatus Pelagibacter bacterium]|nr:hypothetical protein [Candidatus Pelagibacter bacterium]
MTKQTIDITPNWKTSGEILIMALQNPKLSKQGFDEGMETIREMASKLDIACKELNKLAKRS